MLSESLVPKKKKFLLFLNNGHHESTKFYSIESNILSSAQGSRLGNTSHMKEQSETVQLISGSIAPPPTRTPIVKIPDGNIGK